MALSYINRFNLLFLMLPVRYYKYTFLHFALTLKDVTCLRNQLGARISVHVDAAPSVDLTRVLSEVREQYENMMERNLREVESIFIARVNPLLFGKLYDS